MVNNNRYRLSLDSHTGYVMKTVGVTQMPVRHEAPLVSYHSQDSMDLESTTGEDRPWRPVPPTAEGSTL